MDTTMTKQSGKAIFQYLATFSASLTVITSGMHYGWPSPSLPKLLHKNSTIPVTNSEGSWMAVMPLLGAALGSVIVCFTVDIIGRKRTIILSSIPFFAAWIMVAFSKSVVVLCLARFIAGISDACVFTAIPMYIGEIADPKIRGLLGSSVMVMWIFGMLLINLVGAYLSIKLAALVSSILPIVFLLTFCWMPDSPYYLLMRRNLQGAKKSLQTFRGLADVDSELDRLNVNVKSQMTRKGKILDLFTKKGNRKAVFIMIILRSVQQLSGTTAITFYLQPIFKEGGTNISSEVTTAIYFSIQLILAAFSSSIVDKAGRRPLLIMSIIGSAIMLFIEGTYFCIKTQTDVDVSNLTIIPVIALIGYVIVFSLGVQIIPIMMIGELFPTNVKAIAMSLTVIYYAIIATIVAKFFQIMKDSFGIYVPFYAFAASCILGLVCIILFVPETKGKTLEEIQMYLRGETEYDSAKKINEVDLAVMTKSEFVQQEIPLVPKNA